MQGRQGRGVTEYWSPDERVCERCGTRVREADLRCRECGVPFVDIALQESGLHQSLVGLLVVWSVIVPLLVVGELWLSKGQPWLVAAEIVDRAYFVPWATGVLMLGVLCYVTDRRGRG